MSLKCWHDDDDDDDDDGADDDDDDEDDKFDDSDDDDDDDDDDDYQILRLNGGEEAILSSCRAIAKAQTIVAEKKLFICCWCHQWRSSFFLQTKP